MPETSRDVSSIVPDPTALKALTHPQRLRMLAMLRVEGPATASGLAGRLGLNSGATSYHLRQLALHGFIKEDKERGSQRERWWRARHETTSFAPSDARGEVLESGMAFGLAALNWQMQQMQRSLAEYPSLTAPWRRASTISDYAIPMTAEGAATLVHKLQALLDEALAAAPPLGGPTPPDMKPFAIILHAAPYVLDGAVSE